MVERRGLGGSRRAHIVVRRDGVQDLCQGCRIEQISGKSFDGADAKLYVAQELTFASLRKAGRALELDGPTDVVKERRRYEDVRPKSKMELTKVSAHGCDRDRVLKQSACIAVMTSGYRRQAPVADPYSLSVQESLKKRMEAGMAYLAGQELEEAVELT